MPQTSFFLAKTWTFKPTGTLLTPNQAQQQHPLAMGYDTVGSLPPEQTAQALSPWCVLCRETAHVKAASSSAHPPLALWMLKNIALKLQGVDLNPGQSQFWWNTKAPSSHLSLSPRMLQPQSQACRLSLTFSLFKGKIYRHAKKSEFRTEILTIIFTVEQFERGSSDIH